jgi:hypothetical protein
LVVLQRVPRVSDCPGEVVHVGDGLRYVSGCQRAGSAESKVAGNILQQHFERKLCPTQKIVLRFLGYDLWLVGVYHCEEGTLYNALDLMAYGCPVTSSKLSIPLCADLHISQNRVLADTYPNLFH